MLSCEQRAGRWLPAAFLSYLVPATTEATIASNYLRAEATALFQKLLALLSKEVRIIGSYPAQHRVSNVGLTILYIGSVVACFIRT